jgi:hypothetical protein
MFVRNFRLTVRSVSHFLAIESQPHNDIDLIFGV